MKYKILNIQSTGLGEDEYGRQRAIDIGIVEVEDGKIQKNRYQTFINPERPIQAEATKLHGHTYESLMGEKTFKDKAVEIKSALEGGDCLITHSHYALSLLNHEFQALNDPDSFPEVGLMFGGHIEKVKEKGELKDKVKGAQVIDLYQLCVRYLGMDEKGAYTLEALCERYGIAQWDLRSGAHQSPKKDDRVYQVLNSLVEEIGTVLNSVRKMPQEDLDKQHTDYRHLYRLKQIEEKLGDKLTPKGLKLEEFLELEATKSLSFRILPKPANKSKARKLPKTPKGAATTTKTFAEQLPSDSPLSHSRPLRRKAMTPEQADEYSKELNVMFGNK